VDSSQAKSADQQAEHLAAGTTGNYPKSGDYNRRRRRLLLVPSHAKIFPSRHGYEDAQCRSSTTYQEKKTNSLI
jgi:hypothetical protein